MYINREFQMTTERDNCGLTSLLPMSCRGRAEAFARSLHSRLSSLGTPNGSSNGSISENSWLQMAPTHDHPSTIALTQPRHSADSEMYLDFGLLEPPSPEEDIEEAELHRLLNRDNLKHSHSEDCHCTSAAAAAASAAAAISTVGKDKQRSFQKKKNGSIDSDSDGPFFDTLNDLEQRLASSSPQTTQNGTGEHRDDSWSETVTQDSYATTTDNTVPISLNTSTLSLTSLTDIPNEQEASEAIEEKQPETETQKTETVEVKINGCTPETDLTADETITITHSEEQAENRTSSEDEDERIPRVRRCSSLKTGKTPPGTPGRKKIVRFADVLGLDLADVRTFLDEIPKIPTSAYDDLRDVELSEPAPIQQQQQQQLNLKCHGVKIDKVLLPLFQQPGGLLNFLDMVRDNYVCMENAIVDDPINFSIKGSVRVRNLDFHKSVHVRYTMDGWKTFHDVQATYVQNSCDGFSDRFTFLVYAGALSVGQRLEFACRFQCKGCQYWDNNKGVNYCFQCLPATSQSQTSYAPITGADVDHWGASFY